MPRSFAGWTPIHVHRRTAQPEFLWSRLGVTRFDDPFFTQTVTTALQSPLARLLQRTTSLDELVNAAEREPAVEPCGFIFHVSRCGSTLVSQMLARIPRLIVISEACPLMDAVDDPRLTPGDRACAFRALVRLYGRPSGVETASVFKFGLREIFAWRFIAEMFPHVPRLVLHRDPVEVLVSNLASPCEAVFPGAIPAESLGALPHPITGSEDYTKFVFSRIFAHAAAAASAPGSLTLNYTELPRAVEARIAPHFGIAPTDADRAAMRGAVRFNAKDATRSVEFAPDSETKQRAASAALREFCETVIGPSRRQLCES